MAEYLVKVVGNDITSTLKAIKEGQKNTHCSFDLVGGFSVKVPCEMCDMGFPNQLVTEDTRFLLIQCDRVMGHYMRVNAGVQFLGLETAMVKLKDEEVSKTEDFKVFFTSFELENVKDIDKKKENVEMSRRVR